MTVRSLKVTACVILRSGRRRRILSVGDFIEAKILHGVYPEPRVEILRLAQNDFLRNQNVSRETFFSSLFFFNVLETKESLYSVTY
jgi:hypothetical protein